MDDFKYNYVVVGGSNYYEVAYANLLSLPNVAYFKSYLDGIKSNVIKILLRINFNLHLNKYIPTPFRKIVFPLLFQHHFSNDKPICFIFFESQFAIYNTRYIEYLKRKYPGSKFVLYMQDLVSSLPYYDINSYKYRFDLIFSYDKGDCKKYSLHYFPTPYSYYNISNLDKKESIDVYFCGAGKTRYKAIFEVYKRCVREKLKCKFFITGVPKSERIQGEGLIYDCPITYIENLSYVAASKCVLEIMQENADGYSLRLWEAMMYNKHLLTNNHHIINSDFYFKEFIHFVSETKPFDNWINTQVCYPESLRESKSPIWLLREIENLI